MASDFEVIIIGGGVAGISMAYFLAERGVSDMLLLEREPQPAYHSTGRSAATLAELDANPVLLRLKVQSAPFFRDPPTEFNQHPILSPIGVLTLYPESAWPLALQSTPQLGAAGLRFEVLSSDETCARVPVLAREQVAGALLVAGDGRIDVHELLTSYRRRAGLVEQFGLEVKEIVRSPAGRCSGVATNAGTFQARWIVNAAGAWASSVGRLAGAAAVPLRPHRRTIVVFAAPEPIDPTRWPFVTSEAHQVYFAPESGGVLLSPMDEDPSEPCDAQPDDLVIAGGLERLRVLAPALMPRSLKRKWSGLRTFVPDRVPVVGEDPHLPGFFWLAGQGGCGIETSPTIGRIAADLLVSGATSAFDAALLSPARLAAPPTDDGGSC